MLSRETFLLFTRHLHKEAEEEEDNNKVRHLVVRAAKKGQQLLDVLVEVNNV